MIESSIKFIRLVRWLWYTGWKNVWSRKLSSAICVLLITLGVGLTFILISTDKALEHQMDKNLKGIDMVVGAKGSPLQIVLASIYHVDAPTGNIPLHEANSLKSDPFVEKAIPLSFGDNYQGYRIVGTDHSYVEHFEGELANGTLWDDEMQVVLGAKAEERLGLRLGSSFHGTHGLGAEGHGHEEDNYKVVGTLKPTGAVIDQLILTGLSSVWSIHDDHDHEKDSIDHREITAMLIKFRSPMGMMRLPRKVNTGTSMQAALPAIEMNRLTSLLGVGMDALKALAMLIILVSGISVVVALVISIKEHRDEYALLRLMGMRRSWIVGSILNQASYLTNIGTILGLIFGWAGMKFLSSRFEGSFNYELAISGFSLNEIVLILSPLWLVFFVSIIPAILAFRTDIARTLSDA